MRKYGLILLFFSSIIYAQKRDHLDRIFTYLQNNQFYKAKLINEEESFSIKKTLNSYLDYYIDGKSFILQTNNINISNKKEKLVYHLINGELLLHQDKPNDSLAFINYKEALKIAKKIDSDLYLKSIYKKMCDLFLKNNYSNDYLQNTINKYKKIASNNEDLFWIEYYSLSNKLEKSNVDFEKAYQLSNENPILTSIILQLEGIYCTNFSSNFERAEEVYHKALKLLEPYDYFIIKKRFKKIKFNLGIVQFKRREYFKAIGIFKAIDLNKKHSKIKLFKYHWLHKCYDSLGNIDSAYYYNIRFHQLKDSVDKKAHALSIVKTETKEIISNKEKTINSLKSKMNTIIPIALIITILLGIVFILYKKYYKKTETLEEEKSETIKKIDELKQIVIKNHIILKDKTKVYIADLLYIKSDDHYLKVFLSNGKNHFVRGKLSKIIEELPPNFIRSHRSYIVNRNFIKQINNTNIILVDKTEIPLSRSYKDKL